MVKLKKLVKLQTNVNKFNDRQFVSDLINKAIMIHEKEIVQLNTQSQIYTKGVKADGTRIKPKGKPYPIYSAGYEKKKRKAGKYQGHVDLSWTGRYLKSYNIIPLFDKFILEAPDIILSRAFNLSDHLKDFYGKEIEGLTSENLIKITQLIKPTLINLYRNELFK